MKTKFYFMFIALSALLLVACDKEEVNNSVPPPPLIDRIEGDVTNEEGEMLDSIKLTIFFDEALTDFYPFHESYDNLSEEDKLNAPQEMIEFSELRTYKGYISANIWLLGVYPTDIYVLAHDPAEVYADTVVKGTLEECVNTFYGEKYGSCGLLHIVMKHLER